MLAHTFKPGDEVPVEGVYRVHHYQHRLSHLVRTRFLHFPWCRTCHELVRFETVLILETCPLAPLLAEDPDFANATVRVPQKTQRAAGGA
jgi:hypothetical protein